MGLTGSEGDTAIGFEGSATIGTGVGMGMQGSVRGSACEEALGHWWCDLSTTSFELPGARDFLQSAMTEQNSPRALFLKNKFLLIKLSGAGLQDSEGVQGSVARGGACRLPTFQA
jgi:hypothetical protein